MTDFKAICLLRSLLKQRNKWYIDPISPDIPELQDVVEKAKEYADKRLSNMWAITLYWHYTKWRKRTPVFLNKNKEYFNVFIDDLLFALGCKALVGVELIQFEDSCYLQINFI